MQENIKINWNSGEFAPPKMKSRMTGHKENNELSSNMKKPAQLNKTAIRVKTEEGFNTD
jgi:hypothetical protein